MKRFIVLSVLSAFSAVCFSQTLPIGSTGLDSVLRSASLDVMRRTYNRNFSQLGTITVYDTVTDLTGIRDSIELLVAQNAALLAAQNLYNQFHSGTDFKRSVVRAAKGSNSRVQNPSEVNPVPIVFIGNSLTSFIPARFMKALQSGHGFVGLGLDAPAQTKYGGFAPVTKTAWTEYIGDYSTQARWGISGTSLLGVTGDTLRYAPIAGYGLEYTDARIWFLKKSGGGTFKVHVDNAVGTSVSTSASSNQLGCYRLSGLSSNITPHAITIDSISADVTLYGIETFNSGVYGIEPIWLCTGGVTASTQWEANLSFMRVLLDTLQPAVTNIWLGANDAASSVSASTYSTAMRRIIDTLQAVDSSAIVVWTHYGRGSSPGVEDGAYYSAITTYRDTLIAIAQREGISYWDTWSYWPRYVDAYNQGLYSDVTHPSDVGCAFLVNGILDWLVIGERGYVTEYMRARHLTADQYYGTTFTIDTINGTAGIYVRTADNLSRSYLLDRVLNFYPRSVTMGPVIGNLSVLAGKNIEDRPDLIKMSDNYNNFRYRVDSSGTVWMVNPWGTPIISMGGSGGTVKISSPGGNGFKFEQAGVGTDIFTSGFGKVAINQASAGDSILYVNGGVNVRGAKFNSTITGTSAIRDTSAFTTTATRKAVYISGATSSDFYQVTWRNLDGTTIPTSDGAPYVYAKTDSLIVIRPTGSTSGLSFNWWRVK